MPIGANLQLDWKTIGVGALAVVGLYLFFKGEAKAGAEAVGTAINPLDGNNVVSRAANATTAALTGRQNETSGSFVFRLFNSEDAARLDKYTAK